MKKSLFVAFLSIFSLAFFSGCSMMPNDEEIIDGSVNETEVINEEEVVNEEELVNEEVEWEEVSKGAEETQEEWEEVAQEWEEEENVDETVAVEVVE